jgi:rare lipoprotein A
MVQRGKVLNHSILKRAPSEAHLARVLSAFLCITLCLFAIALSGCGRKQRRTQAPVSTRPVLPSVIGAYEEGVASWYGDPYHGRRTANGEVYDQEKMTAAHPTLRFGVVVDVTNHSNGLRTRVRINDRGPFVDNRAIDLSRAAAREIAMLGPGTAPVRVEVVGLPGTPAAPTTGAPLDPPSAGGSPSGSESTFAVQMGAFTNYENAAALRQKLADRALDVRLVSAPNPSVPGGILWRVLVGQRLTRSEAEKLSGTLRDDFPRIFLVSDH